VRKVGHIAVREFVGTVATRGFIFGLLFTPAMLTLAFTVGPRLMAQGGIAVRGQVAVVDPTGRVAPELRAALAPEAIVARREETTRRALANAPAAVRDIAETSGAQRSAASTGVPDLEVVDRPPEPDLTAAKAWLTDASGSREERRHVGLVAVHPDAVTRADGQSDYGGYDLYVPANLDDRIEAAVHEGVREAIVNARVRQLSLDRRTIDQVVRVSRPPSITVTKTEERATVGVFNRLLPFAFVGLLLFSVLMGGQGLVTSTVEEKSSRVIEVLLSAVSPLELLAGKILGQMCVSLVILAVYIALGLLVLASFTMLGLLDPVLVVYLVLFFLLTYLTMGSLMVAVGAAVNEMREAQSLMMPIVMTMMVPWMLAAPIAREPNSLFSTAISFVPLVNTFAMLLRLTSSAPPPAWQVWLTMLVGVASVGAAVWLAAKVFRIGLLMHGKPPDFTTLVRWVRAS
jgi:ABC-2 type transport system permease protein